MSESTRPYHHGDLRAALIAEAVAMIADGGVDSVTMREIGRRLDVSRAAPYRHFSDKAALLVAVAAAGFDRLNARLRRVEAAPQAGMAPLERLGEEYVRFALAHPAHYRLMYGREALSRPDNPELRDAANTLFEDLAALFEAYQAAGRIRAGDARAQAYVAWSAVHGLASLLTDGQIHGDVEVDELIRLTTETVATGLRVD